MSSRIPYQVDRRGGDGRRLRPDLLDLVPRSRRWTRPAETDPDELVPHVYRIPDRQIRIDSRWTTHHPGACIKPTEN